MEVRKRANIQSSNPFEKIVATLEHLLQQGVTIEATDPGKDHLFINEDNQGEIHGLTITYPQELKP